MSRATDVAAAVETAVEALSLSGVAAGQVVRRKTPAVPEGATLPQVVISVGEEGEVAFFDFENRVLVRYPAAVTIVTAGGSNLAEDATLRTNRERVRKKCHDPATYAGVTGFLTVSATGEPPYDPGALSKDFNFSAFVFTVSVVESRT